MNQVAKTKLPSSEFWRYSLRLYGHENVKDACLNLQSRYDININILLFICYLAQTGRGQISKHELQTIIDELQPWHQGITQGLRNLRQLLKHIKDKDWANDLRKEILEDELTSEQLEQLLIGHLYSAPIIPRRPKSHKIHDCISNFHLYFTLLNIDLTEQDYALLQQLLNQAFPGAVTQHLDQLSISF